MSRPDRWWRPASQRNTRPARVSQRRQLRQMTQSDADHEFDEAFDTGYACGYADGLERLRQRDEQIRRLAEAAEAAQRGEPDDLMRLAEQAGVTPPADGDGEQLVDELEAWLRDQ